MPALFAPEFKSCRIVIHAQRDTGLLRLVTNWLRTGDAFGTWNADFLIGALMPAMSTRRTGVQRSERCRIGGAPGPLSSLRLPLLKSQRRRVNAVTEASGSGAIIEDVAEMAIATSAMNLGARH